MRPQRPPTIVHRGVERAVTPLIISLIAQNGLTPTDYEAFDLVRDYYNFRTIGDLIRDALDRSDPTPRSDPPNTGPFFQRDAGQASAAAAAIVRAYGQQLNGRVPLRNIEGSPL